MKSCYPCFRFFNPSYQSSNSPRIQSTFTTHVEQTFVNATRLSQLVCHPYPQCLSFHNSRCCCCQLWSGRVATSRIRSRTFKNFTDVDAVSNNESKKTRNMTQYILTAILNMARALQSNDRTSHICKICAIVV